MGAARGAAAPDATIRRHLDGAEPSSPVERLRQKLERVALRSVWGCYESGAVWLRVAATARAGPGPLPRDRDPASSHARRAADGTRGNRRICSGGIG